MRAFLISLLVGSATACVYEDFNDWIERFGIEYISAGIHEDRFSIWKANDITIKLHNDAEEHTYTLGHNQFSDLTTEEFEYLHLRGYDQKPGLLNMFQNRMYWSSDNESVPDAIDWREHNIVGAVRNQGHCGSCWAHAAVETVESIRARQTGFITPLSVQQLVSCDTLDSGCSGGLPNNAYRYIQQMGLQSEESYPYTSGEDNNNGLCRDASPLALSRGWVTGFKDIARRDEDALREVVSNHPVSVAVDATKWQFYKSGVFNHNNCGTELNHAVQIVGYNKDGKYYIVRNSWGTSYGEDGYIRVVMDQDMCGISQAASFPTVETVIGDPNDFFLY